MGVEARRDEQQLRLERGDRALGLLERGEVRVVARAAGERDVQQRLALLVGAARARVERPLVQRDEEDRRVVADDVLRPVPVVDVPVEDRDAPEAELGLRPARGDRDRVEEAEAHRLPRPRVVPGRPHEREAAAPHRLDRRARGEQRRVVARLGADRVAVEPAAERPHALDERRRVAAQHVLLARGRALDVREALEQHGEPLPRLRVAPGRVQRDEQRMADDVHGPGATALTKMRAMRLPRMLEPLRIRDFALLWAGMSVSLVGDAIFLVALAWQVYELSNDPSALGWILAAYVTPMVVFLLAGGVLTDRFERRKMMIVADVLRALAIGTAGALAIAGTLELWQLARLRRRHRRRRRALRAGVRLDRARDRAARLARAGERARPVRAPDRGHARPGARGRADRGVGRGGRARRRRADLLRSTAAALLLTPRPFERRPGRSAWRDVREGFAFVRARTWLWATLAVAGLLNVAPAARNVLLPFVVKNDLHASAAALGAVYSATAAGALLSALAYGQRGLPRRFVVVMYVGWAAATFVIAGYGLATGVWQMVMLGFVAGLGLALGQAIWGTMMHQLVPRELLGRVTSVDWLISTSLMPVAMIAVGFVGDAIGPGTTLVLAGTIGGTAHAARAADPRRARPGARRVRRARRAASRERSALARWRARPRRPSRAASPRASGSGAPASICAMRR